MPFRQLSNFNNFKNNNNKFNLNILILTSSYNNNNNNNKQHHLALEIKFSSVQMFFFQEKTQIGSKYLL